MKKKKAFTLVEMLMSLSIFGMIAVIGMSIIGVMTFNVFNGQTESTNRSNLNETVFYITREVQSAEGIRITDGGKNLEIKERGSSGYNLKYSLVDSYPAGYIAFKDKRLLDIDADKSMFYFEEDILKIKLGIVNNNTEVNQRSKEYEISVLPRGDCVKETD